MARRARRSGRLAGLATALALAVWIAWAVRPAGEGRWLWALPVLLTYVLVSRIGRAIAVGVERATGSRRPDGG